MKTMLLMVVIIGLSAVSPSRAYGFEIPMNVDDVL